MVKGKRAGQVMLIVKTVTCILIKNFTALIIPTQKMCGAGWVTSKNRNNNEQAINMGTIDNGSNRYDQCKCPK
jgi:hypothetical protein